MTTSPPTPSTRRPRWLLASLAAVAILGTGVGVGLVAGHGHGGRPAGHATATARTIDTQGKLTTPASSQTIAEWARLHAGDISCTPPAGYDDITDGAQVTVTDEAGRTLAVSQLDVGVTETPRGGGFPRCAFTFHVDVPAGHKLYSFEVGHRGKVTFPARQLETDVVDLSLD